MRPLRMLMLLLFVLRVVGRSPRVLLAQVVTVFGASDGHDQKRRKLWAANEPGAVRAEPLRRAFWRSLPLGCIRQVSMKVLHCQY